jgi:diguanylate cyclase (GGDEF)-like protein
MGILNLSQQSLAYKKYVANRSRRLKQIFWGFEVLLISFSFITFLSQQYLTSSILLFSCMPLLSVYFLLINEKVELGAIALFSFMLVISFGLIWAFNGLRDVAIMAIPVLLIFSAFLAKPKAFFALLLLSIINILAIGTVNYTGIYNHPEPGNTLSSAISWSILVLFLTASIRLLGLDLQRMSRRLSRQNKQVARSKAKAQYLIDHDLLTDLPNKTAAIQKLSEFVFSHGKTKHDCVMLLNLDNFKSVNDSMGHNFGDIYLIEISQRLNKTIGDYGELYHTGGDEFLVVIEATNDVVIRNLIDEIQRVLKTSHNIKGINVKSTTSIGIAKAINSDQTFEDLRLQASMALDKAKANGRNNYFYHNAKLDDDVLALAQLKNDLKDAINNDGLSIVFQPKISLKEKNVVGAEALVCWHHPTLGIITQKKLLLLAEQTGLILDIGDWAITNACSACDHWVSQGYDIPVAISAAVVQFSSGKIIDSVERNLMFTTLNGDHLELQVAEELFSDNSENLVSTLTILKAMGITIVIDNFGTGYSNLSNLKKYDINALKIDYSFIKNINDDYDNAIVRAIINIAKSLDIKVIAEGIETQEIIDTLTDMGSDIGQGYFWSKPLSEEAFINFLDADNNS